VTEGEAAPPMPSHQGSGYGWPVDVEALIRETAAIVATGYASLDVSNAAGCCSTRVTKARRGS